MTKDTTPEELEDQPAEEAEARERVRRFAQSLGPGGSKMLIGMLAMMLGEESTGHRLLAEAAHEQAANMVKRHRKVKKA